LLSMRASQSIPYLFLMIVMSISTATCMTTSQHSHCII
jgi:hypothetical protein